MKCQTQVKPQESSEVSNQKERLSRQEIMEKKAEDRREKKLIYNRKYYRETWLLSKEKVKAKKEKMKKYKLEKPWVFSMTRAKERCSNINSPIYRWYGGKGICVKMSAEDFKELWFRDKAYLMRKPSIDRINSNGNYEKDNCRYIEMLANTRIGAKNKFIEALNRWKNILSEQINSKQTEQDFCIKHSLNISTFKNYKRKINKMINSENFL